MAPRINKRRRWMLWGSLATAIAIGGCAGVPDTDAGLGGTGIVSQAPDEGLGGTGLVAGRPTGGIGGSGHSGPGDDPDGGIGGTGIIGVGIVQGFGSVFVNGREFFLTGSSPVTIDGRAADEGDLARGDTVVVRGRVDPASGRSVADRIDSQHDLIGRVDAVDAGTGQLVVHGQRLIVGPATYGDDAQAAGITLAAFQPGMRVAVSGHLRRDGRWMATRVQRLVDADDRFVVTGHVDAHNRSTGQVRIGAAEFDVAPAAAATIGVGQRVRLSGRMDGTRLRADTVSRPLLAVPVAGQIVEVSGLVQDVTPEGRILCNGLWLRVAPSTQWLGGGGTELIPDLPVSARGRAQRDGSVVIERIVLRADFTRVRLNATGERGASPDAGANATDPPGKSRSPNAGPKPKINKPSVEKPNIHRPDLPPVQGRGASSLHRPPQSYK